MRTIVGVVLLLWAVVTAWPGAAVGQEGPAAQEKGDAPGLGVRGTLVGQGLSAQVSDLESLNGGFVPGVGQQLALPMLELLIPAGSTELLVGLSAAHRSVSHVYPYFLRNDRTVWALAAGAGLAWPIAGGDLTTLRGGGRLNGAYIVSASGDNYCSAAGDDCADMGFHDWQDRPNVAAKGVMVIASGFLAGEHMLSRNFGFQAEVGLSYSFMLLWESNPDLQKDWAGAYAALSAVVRL